MKSYGYSQLYAIGDHLYINSTIPEALKAMENAFAQRPDGLAVQGKHVMSYSSLTFTHLKDHVNKTYWWIMQIFCESGWEPFAIMPPKGSTSNLEQIHFRKEIVN